MPQNRRKVPFSGKKKKQQLLEKRQLKGHNLLRPSDSNDDGETGEETELTARKLMEQPQKGGTGSNRNKNTNRYNLQFYQESKRELELMRQEAYKPFDLVTPKQREIDASYFTDYDFPTRPDGWTYDMSKEKLNAIENRYFREYVDNLQKAHKEKNADLSLFELNLETWRQLWRVLEYSDILLIIVDVRYATLMFPPTLYKYISECLKKHAILVLNKVDLVAPEAVVAWRHYFHDTYPGMPVVLFASCANKPGRTRNAQSLRQNHKRSMEGVYNIYKESHKIVKNSDVDLTAWEQKILEDMKAEHFLTNELETNATADGDADEQRANRELNQVNQTVEQPPRKCYENGILTIGCIGFPNVGKSTLINALKGRKVVSVSRTPGHTKHFQTIFLTSHVRLCDCPGLVFPSRTPKYLQVLLGSYPISQLQVPYRSLKFMSEHLNLPQLLKLHLPEDFEEWSPAAVADAWALKRGFLTAKAARPDRYRAANHLLRMCLAGQQQLILQFYPPGFHEALDKWQQHVEIQEVKKYQNHEDKALAVDDDDDDASSVNSESCDSDEAHSCSSSSDETNLDEGEDEAGAFKSNAIKNTFALLEDE